ncbi:hypothetical protein ACIOWI_36850 [Streptomyces sp. NPDC087659]|uniref:hypothetical protein n=1 Tax=Streptomyces sp. NPDC087659 TaxID=3365801 RepID=UPI00381BF5A3
MSPKLQALNDALASTERVGTAMRWLSGGIVSTVLSDLGSGRRPLTHEALDELPAGKVVEHIRSVLVATGTLPQRDEQMVRLERHVNDLVTSHATVEGRKILHRYATWHLLRRLRRRSRGNDITHTQLTVVRQHLRAAVHLLNWLEAQGPDTCDLPSGRPRTLDDQRRRPSPPGGRPLRALGSRPEDRPRPQLPGRQMERSLPGNGGLQS